MKNNIPLGPNINFNSKYTIALWGDRGIDDFWFYQENSNQWYYYDIAKQEFFLVAGDPRNANNLEEISLQVFEDVRDFIRRKNQVVLNDIPLWPDTPVIDKDPWAYERWT